MLNGSKLPKIASVTAQPTLWQCLYVAGVGENQGHSDNLIEWIHSGIGMAWPNEGLPPPQMGICGRVTRHRELGMKRALYIHQFQRPDEESFTAGMKGLILQSTLGNQYQTLVSVLALRVNQPIHMVVAMVADPRETEKIRHREKGGQLKPKREHQKVRKPKEFLTSNYGNYGVSLDP